MKGVTSSYTRPSKSSGKRFGSKAASGQRGVVRAQEYFPERPPVEPKPKPKAVLVNFPRPGYEIIVVNGRNVEIPIGRRCGMIPDNERVTA